MDGFSDLPILEFTISVWYKYLRSRQKQLLGGANTFFGSKPDISEKPVKTVVKLIKK